MKMPITFPSKGCSTEAVISECHLINACLKGFDTYLHTVGPLVTDYVELYYVE
jgi:hypothetical protein